MLIFDSKEFARMINLRFFYAQEGNLAMAAQLDRDIDEMIATRIANSINL